MFPLGRGIFPGAPLTLRVFEPRYLEMIDLCVRRRIGFGVVLIERGSEVGGGDARFDVGVAARIERVLSLGNDQLMVAARGESRIRVDEWLEDEPYPQARVRYLPDPARVGAGSPAARGLRREFRRGLALFSELGVATAGVDPLPDDPMAAAYRALDVFPTPDIDRQRVLELDDPAERIERTVSILRSVNGLVEARLESG